MPSPAQLNRVRGLLAAQSKAASDDFSTFLAGLHGADRAVMSTALAEGWVSLIEHYGDITAELAAEQFDEWADELGIRPRLKVAPGVDERRATARLAWAVSSPDQLGCALGLLDELVKQPFRSTVHDSAFNSGAAWARVPSGLEPCAFCLMLASRGAVYRSEKVAKFGNSGKKYHGTCWCVPTLVRDAQDYPEGYDPDALYDQYDAARQAADSAAPEAILSTLREQQGTH